jgi:hypothetical protein
VKTVMGLEPGPAPSIALPSSTNGEAAKCRRMRGRAHSHSRAEWLIMTDSDARPSLAERHVIALKQATGRQDIADALRWIAEKRSLVTGTTTDLLVALVEAASCDLPSADAALRVAARRALESTLDTSADLLGTDTIVPPHRYQEALSDVASRAPTGSLASINPQVVGSAQADNSLVVEALALVAGLSWRDLRDRSEARDVPLPGQPSGPWKSSQIQSAFDIIDEVVQGNVKPQLSEAVAARPLELLLDDVRGWGAVEILRTGGVSYGTLLAQRDVGSAWSAHRNRTNSEISRLMVLRLLSSLTSAGIKYWSTEGDAAVPRAFLGEKAVTKGKVPGQLSIVTRLPDGSPHYAVLIAVARDGGTARKTAATLLKLPALLSLPGAAVLVGTGWADRGESDALVRAFGGRVYTEHSLPALAALAAEPS